MLVVPAADATPRARLRTRGRRHSLLRARRARAPLVATRRRRMNATDTVIVDSRGFTLTEIAHRARGGRGAGGGRAYPCGARTCCAYAAATPSSALIALQAAQDRYFGQHARYASETQLAARAAGGLGHRARSPAHGYYAITCATATTVWVTGPRRAAIRERRSRRRTTRCVEFTHRPEWPAMRDRCRRRGPQRGLLALEMGTFLIR